MSDYSQGCDDGDRIQHTADMIGCAFISALNELDLDELLHDASEIKDLGLMMSLYIGWSSSLERFNILDEEFEWQAETVAYARKANIDLEAVGCYGVSHRLDALEETHGQITPLEGDATVDRWSWKKKVKRFLLLESAFMVTNMVLVQGA